MALVFRKTSKQLQPCERRDILRCTAVLDSALDVGALQYPVTR